MEDQLSIVFELGQLKAQGTSLMSKMDAFIMSTIKNHDDVDGRLNRLETRQNFTRGVTWIIGVLLSVVSAAGTEILIRSVVNG